MNNKETPWDFFVEKRYGKYKLKYFSLKEISQGSPEIGNISINNKTINDLYFGGPSLNKGTLLIIPVFVKSFFKRGFKICLINMETFKISTIGKTKNLIILTKIENNNIYFYENLSMSKICFTPIPDSADL